MKLPEAFLRGLDEGFPSGFSTNEPDALESHGRDWTRVHAPRPSLLVRPHTTDEVARLLRLADALRVPIVPSGGRTGLAAGAVAASGEVVLSMERMRRIDPVDELAMTVRVQAGAVTAAVHAHCEARGLTWPVDFASKGSSQIGGNISTNAGGVKVIRYGLTRHWVLGLQVVTARGDVLELNGALEKNATGLDLRQLFIGTEGTFGVITEATLKLTRVPSHLDVFLFALPDLGAVLELFRRARRGPFVVSAFELFTDRCLARVRSHRRLRDPLSTPAPCYALLEVEAHDRGALEGWMEALVGDEAVLDGTLAQTLAQARALWELREGISESLAATGVAHKNDVALPIASLGAFCAELERTFAERYPGFEICLFGHIGDGNLHVNVMKPDTMGIDEFRRVTHAADAHLFELVRHHHGSVSAEHGIGLLKKEWLSYTRSEVEIALMRDLKRVLDPHGILNPGKILPDEPLS